MLSNAKQFLYICPLQDGINQQCGARLMVKWSEAGRQIQTIKLRPQPRHSKGYKWSTAAMPVISTIWLVFQGESGHEEPCLWPRASYKWGFLHHHICLPGLESGEAQSRQISLSHCNIIQTAKCVFHTYSQRSSRTIYIASLVFMAKFKSGTFITGYDLFMMTSCLSHRHISCQLSWFEEDPHSTPILNSSHHPSPRPKGHLTQTHQPGLITSIYISADLHHRRGIYNCLRCVFGKILLWVCQFAKFIFKVVIRQRASKIMHHNLV